jgi:hypothetical protein
MKTRAILGAVAAGILLLGCGDDSTSPPPPQPVPGELVVTVGGGSALGGIFLTVTGAGITAPAASGVASLYYDVSGTTLSATVVGSTLSGEVLRFSVPDVRNVTDYQVTVQQVAGTSNQPLSPGGFSATVSVAP